MYTHGIDMRVHVNGRPTREYQKNGMSFIEARLGTNYTVKLKNDNSYKVMAVLSVDGLDVITGKPAEESNKGYILDPYSSVEIKGYRISDENSAAFIFTSKGKSYVQQTKGDARNSGVIGVRVFGEKVQVAPKMVVSPVSPWNPYVTDYTHSGQFPTPQTYTTYANYVSVVSDTTTGVQGSVTYTTNAVSNNCIGVTGPNGALGAQGTYGIPTNANKNSRAYSRSALSNAFDTPLSYKQFDTGTGWGKKLDDRVKKEYFEKGNLLTEIVTYYASREALESMGIDMTDSPRVSDEDLKPKAFGSKYCQPPKGWVG
jgi:hypothetical protein